MSLWQVADFNLLVLVPENDWLWGASDGVFFQG